MKSLPRGQGASGVREQCPQLVGGGKYIALTCGVAIQLATMDEQTKAAVLGLQSVLLLKTFVLGDPFLCDATLLRHTHARTLDGTISLTGKARSSTENSFLSPLPSPDTPQGKGHVFAYM